MNIAWPMMRRDRPQMLSCMNLRIIGGLNNNQPLQPTSGASATGCYERC
jgi:hypothetical protein